MNYRAYVAELLGTATLTFAVLVTLSSSVALATPVAAGLTLTLFVYTIGPISGSHINPAVTVGLWSIGKITPSETAKYVVAQILGALLALQLAVSLGLNLADVQAVNSPTVAVGEVIGAFFLVFGICSVVHQKVGDAASGLVIGGSLLLSIILAAPFSNGVLNPAVAIGIGSVSLLYLVAPLAGAIGAAQLYKWLAQKG